MFMGILVWAMAAALTSPQSIETTRLDDLIVVGRPTDPLISVVVSGDIPATAIVRSDPVAVRCGLTRFHYDPFASPRLCWIRRPTGTPIRLQAEGGEALGPRWRVEWDGCVPDADGRACVVTTPVAGVNVRAHFVAD